MSIGEVNDRVIESVVYRRIAPVLLCLSFVIAIVAAVGTYVNDQAITSANTKRIADNESNAKTNCENANESRAASRTLWFFALDLVAQDADPAEAAYLAQVRSWVGDVYVARDCNDLGRKYTIPPPPERPAAAQPS